MPASLILDIIISVLLVLTIAYAVRLNQRLSQLRSDKNELLVLAKTFADATMRAESAIKNLKVSSESLGSEVAKAEALKDDLAYLVNRGGRTADEMVDTVRGYGSDDKSAAGSASKPSFASGRKSLQADDDTRLIEEAIRAATPTAEENKSAAGTENTRRITGRLGAKPSRTAGAPDQGRESRQPSSRDLSAGFDEDDEAIGDTAAARELLKALGAVK